MISTTRFNKTYANCYCQTPELIENYEQAIADTTRIWVCHHRDEIRILPSGMIVIRSHADLIENNRYYNCPPNELIFLSPSEHMSLHSKYADHPKGRKPSEETKKKMGLAHKGKKHTEETKEKMRLASKGKKHTEETKKKLSMLKKGQPSKIRDTYRSEFGKKFFERFGYGKDTNSAQYAREMYYYRRYGCCSWEKEE